MQSLIRFTVLGLILLVMPVKGGEPKPTSDLAKLQGTWWSPKGNGFEYLHFRGRDVTQAKFVWCVQPVISDGRVTLNERADTKSWDIIYTYCSNETWHPPYAHVTYKLQGDALMVRFTPEHAAADPKSRESIQVAFERDDDKSELLRIWHVRLNPKPRVSPGVHPSPQHP